MKAKPTKHKGYTVTATGDVYRNGKLCRQFHNRNGARVVNITTSEYVGSAIVARLVGEAFCADYRPELRAFYVNGNKDDCRACNLVWVPVSMVGPFTRNPKVKKQ